jgi:hypothetical protein
LPLDEQHELRLAVAPKFFCAKLQCAHRIRFRIDIEHSLDDLHPDLAQGAPLIAEGFAVKQAKHLRHFAQRQAVQSVVLQQLPLLDADEAREIVPA